MTNLKLFSLEGKGLKLTSEEDIKPHIQDLLNSSDFEEIRLQGNTIGVEAAATLASALEKQKKLQIANLADIFTGRLLNEIPPALESILRACLALPSLHTLNLSDNAFGLNTQAPLVSFLSSHTALQHLYLTNNGLGPEAGTLIANALISLSSKKDSLRSSSEGKDTPALETIICGRNRLENGSMASWAKAFEAHRGIKVVKMVQNGIRQEGISLLLKQGLKFCEGLEVLDLQDNTFTSMGARALADVLPGWGTLKELGVSDCLLSARGGVVLGEALGKGANKELEVLRCQYDEVDGKGVTGIVQALGKCERLRRVELNGNKFDEEDPGVEELRRVLEERREKAGAEEGSEEWGLDELDELEEPSDEEDEGEGEEEAEEEDVKEKAERELKQVDQAEAENVPQVKDKEVDELANLLGKTGL
ncbi:MAG: hypothetical protein M1820_002583 [Bogoriella megaspora]|nr:MAG: hypothetical protein M1820_002583 [Bogoriella megaspora]